MRQYLLRTKGLTSSRRPALSPAGRGISASRLHRRSFAPPEKRLRSGWRPL